MSQVLPIAEMFERLRAEVREARFAAVLEEARAWAARQQSARLPMGPTSPDFPASWPMSLTLSDVVRWRDADFVHACYQAILRHAPDPVGFAFYLNEVRSGRSRIEIAVGFVKSDEGRKAGVQVAGAQLAAFSLRLGRIPVLGYLLRMAKGILLLPRRMREREAVEAYLLARTVIAENESHGLRLETAYLHERQARNIGARLARLADQSQVVLDRLPAVEAALEQVRAASIAELAQASAAARSELTVAASGLRAEIHAVRASMEETSAAARETVRRVEAQEGRFCAIDAVQKDIAEFEARLTELVTREDELLERRVADRLGALDTVERNIESLRAALATFAQAGKP